MEQKNLDLQNPVINEAFLSLSEAIWGSVEERFEGLDSIIDSLIYRLFREGPRAFDDFQNFFPFSAKQNILGNQPYQVYLNTYLKAHGQILHQYSDKTPSHADFEQPLNGPTPEMNQPTPQKEEMKPQKFDYAPPIHDVQERMEESKIQEPQSKESQNLKNSVLNKSGVNATPKVDDSQIIKENTLEEVFKNLKGEIKLKYDPNFTSIYGLADEKIRKENIIADIINQHKESDFSVLFGTFLPFLFDLLKRREGFEDFVQILRRVSAKEKISCQKIIKNLEVKDVIILLLESCSKESMAKLGPWLANQYYPLPILYPTGKNTFKVNLDCCFELMFQARKMLITSVGTKNSVNKGKSSLLSYLFSTKNPTYFSTVNGFTHAGSVDLYAKLPQENFEYIVADVNGYVDNPAFKTITEKLLGFSQLGIIHITAEDAKEHSKDDFARLINEILPTETNFVILFRDYDDDEHNEILENINKAMEKHQNFLETIPVPKMDAPQNFDIQNDKLEVLEAITKVLNKLESNSFWPIAEIKKSYDFNIGPMNGSMSSSRLIKTEFEKESKMIQSLLDAKYKENNSLYKMLFPCFWLDFLLNEEYRKKTKMDTNYADLTEAQVIEISQKYEEISKKIKEYQVSKSQVQPSELIKNICLILSSNEIARILLLSETINDWKMPIFAPIKQQYLKLCAEKKVVNEAEKNALDKEIQKLETEMDDKDVTLDTFLDEIHSLHESGKVGDAFGIEGIKDYVYSNMRQGAPINLVNGKTLKFGNKLLQELFENYENDNKKVYVVSIIGAQSSAKSTLLNVLFGCGFVTSAGRCTKGLYISLLEHPNGCHLIVIDTEGLLSVVARDHEFDNLITTMAFSCSHLVIINNKGEINTKLRDLLEICVYAMKHLRLTHIKPKIIFALRDIADDNPKVQQEMLIHMKTQLEQAASKLSINIDTLIDISEEDVFLLPSAFQLSRGENGSKIQTNNNLFSQKVLDMRNYILKYLDSINIDSASVLNPKWFYTQTEQLWGDITQHGKDIMKARNFLEIELKDDALDQVNLIFKKFNQIFCNKGRTLLDNQKNQLKGKNVGYEDNFSHLLTSEFNKMKNNAITELEVQVLNNEKYAAISSYHREFREILEFYLGWQKQNFLSEWRSSLISYEAIKSVNDFKAKLKLQVDDILQNKGDPGSMNAHILVLFEQIKQRCKADFTERLDKLQLDNINKLAPKIQLHFECAQQKKSRKDRERVIIPSVGELIERITAGHARYNQSKWLKLNRVGECWNKYARINMNEELETISKEFQTLLNNFDNVINQVSTEENASNILTMCLESVKKMEAEGTPINFASFVPCCLLEAMHVQYSKTKEAEIERMKKLQAELETVLADEEKLIAELLDQSQNSYKRGETTANKCYREIQKVFCQEKEDSLHNAVMEKIREEFPAPESANIKAYQNSFEISNYENVVKYVLNINKFIKEIYDAKIKTIAEFEIEKHLAMMKNDFIDLIQQTIAVAKKWHLDNQNKGNVDLSTLYMYATQNAILSPYFPDLYIVQLSDINAFARGFETTLSTQLSNFDTKKELKNIVYEKVEEYLSNQYQILVGCQARCPVCNNKCVRPDANHKDHHTNCHLLAAFSGVKDRKTKEVVLNRCFDTYNYQCRWYSGQEMFNNFDDYINRKYPEWRKEFPTKQQTDKHEVEIPAKFIECWVACKDVLIKYYRYRDKTPPQWDRQVPKEKRLKSDLIIQGYNTERDKQSL